MELEKSQLEQKKAQRNVRMEKMALETNIAAYNARLKVLESVETTSQSHAVAAHLLSQEDGINSYFENQEPEVYEESEPPPVEFAALGAVPKTPFTKGFTTTDNKAFKTLSENSHESHPSAANSKV